MDKIIADRIIGIISAQALVPPSVLNAGTRLEDLGLDSLGLVEVIFAVEEAFDVQVPFNANRPDVAAFDLTTVGTVIQAVEGLLAQKAA